MIFFPGGYRNISLIYHDRSYESANGLPMTAPSNRTITNFLPRSFQIYFILQTHTKLFGLRFGMI